MIRLETLMRSPSAPEGRSPQGIVRELRHKAVFVEAAVAVTLLLSTILLIYIASLDASLAAKASLL
jgi:hypothetical protein